MKQQLKYGLTTGLRTFELPEVWNGSQVLLIEADSKLLFKKDDDSEQAFSVPEGYKGTIVIKRQISGNKENKLNIKVEGNVNVKIVEEISGEGTYRGAVQLDVKECSAVEYAVLQNLSENSVCLLNYQAAIENGTMKWNSCFLGGDTTTALIETAAGGDTNTINNAVVSGNRQQQFDIHVSTKHTGTNSTSNMLTRSVLDGKSRAVYHGLINISPQASGCDSYQKDEVILVSDNAGADAIPNLEIQNNNVRCTHGASIGKLDEEKLFYLQSRGINDTDAKRIITEGFLEPLTLPAWQHLIREKISRS